MKHRSLPPGITGSFATGVPCTSGPWQLSCVSHLRVRGYEQLARALHPEAFP